MATWTNNNATYYINPAYLTFVENSGYGANLIQVSASSSCYISVHIPGVIDYSDADKNYKRWKIIAYNNKFPDNDKFYIYVRLEKNSYSALIIYDKSIRGIHGGKIVEKTNENGDVIKEEGEYDPEHPYFYINIGEVGGTDGVSIRSISYDTGYLTSNKSNDDKMGVNEMWELDKYSTPWLIRAKHWLSSFTVKGFISLVGGFIFKGNDGIEKPIVDIKRSIDDDVPVDDTTIPTTGYIRNISDDRYLKKNEEDETKYKITFYDGIEAGQYVKGMVGGSGTKFDGQGYGEMNGLTLREFLEVPELRFNRVDVVSGELWNSVAFGLIERVDENRKICWLKLEDKERSGLHVYDICRGIFADFGESESWEGEDECGFLHLYGFYTSYFTPTEIIENKEGVFSFKYELKAGTYRHPSPSMKFAVYGNFVDTGRQASAYSTRTYKRYLNKVDTWVINPDKNIYAQYGDLEGLQIGSVQMHGYGSFQSNAYFKGVQIQLTPSQMESLKGESAYTAILSDYEGVVSIDDEGNVVGGPIGLQNVLSGGLNVVSDGKNVITEGYRLTTEVQAMRGSTQLFYSPSSPSDGCYVLNITSVGCNAVVLNGVVAVTAVTDPQKCHVNILVNCEGKASFNLVYRINAIRDGKSPIVADIDNEMDAIACDSTGKVLFGLPVNCTVSMWAGVKKLQIERLEVNPPPGVIAYAEKETGVVSVTSVSDEADKVLPVNIVVYASHGGVRYSKKLVFTINKVNAGENALLYKLSPSASSVKVDDEGVMTATTVSCEVVCSNGSHIAALNDLPEGLDMEYSIGGADFKPYTYQAPIEINDGDKVVTFRLYSNGALVDVENIPILLDGRSPVVLDIDNEMFSVPCDENGEVLFMPDISATVQMYWGSKELDTQVVELIVPNGIEAEYSGSEVRVVDISGDSEDTLRLGVRAKADYGETTYTHTGYMVINKIRQGNSAWVLDLTPSVSAVKIDKKGAYIPEYISCRTKMTKGKDGVSEPGSIQDNYTIKYSFDGGQIYPYNYGTDLSAGDANESVEFFLYYSKDNGKDEPWVLVDKETVPILADAADAFKSTVFTRSENEPAIPQGGSYDSPIPEDLDEYGWHIWEDGIPSGEAVLWASVRTFTSNGKDPQDDSWSIPSQMTETASFDVVFSSDELPDDPFGHPNENRQWSHNASQGTIWMATCTKANGKWSDWQVSKIKGEKGDKGDKGDKGGDGDTAFQSTVFYRSNQEPDTPTGGDFNCPKPTSSPTWSDGIPSGEEILWGSTRIFTKSGGSPQQSVWSTPRQMTDTASFDVEWSSMSDNPGTPDSNPSAWSNLSGEDTVWMATRTKVNGEWNDWQVSKIKGEKGEKGDKGDSGPQGPQGPQGSSGESVVNYVVLPGTLVIGKTMTGTISPESTTFTCYRDTGHSTRSEETAIWHAYRRNSSDENWSLFNSQTSYSASFSVTFSSSYKYYKITANPYTDREVQVFPTMVEDGQNGLPGSPGPRGAMPRYCGEFKNGGSYVYNEEYRDIVVYNGNVYQVYAYGSTVSSTPSTSLSNGYNDGKWEMASKFSFVAMDTALIDGANIAGFEFKSNKMVSQYGHLIIDGVNGTLECNDVDLTGVINADGGVFKNVEIESAAITGDITVTNGLFQMSINPSAANNRPGMSWSYGGTEYAMLGLWENNGYASGALWLKNNGNSNEATSIYPNMIFTEGSGYDTTIAGGEINLGSPANTIDTRIYVDNRGRFRLYSYYWPLESSAGTGDMYVDGSGYVKVKNPNRI